MDALLSYQNDPAHLQPQPLPTPIIGPLNPEEDSLFLESLIPEMSLDDGSGPAQDGGSTAAPRYKSFKKKYMKIRARFNTAMAESNALWETEQKMQKTARRLEEELDQLRELIADVNDASFTASYLQLDLRPSDTEEAAYLESLGVKLPKLTMGIFEEEDEYSPEAAKALLNEAKKQLTDGEITQSDLDSIANKVGPYIQRGNSLSYLETTVPHTRLEDVDESILPDDIKEEHPVGYLDPEHEAEYLDRLDAELDGRIDTHPIRGRQTSPLNAARDNPMSSLNWLRKNQPQVFLQDHDAHEKAHEMKRGSIDEGGSKPRASGRGKKGSMAHELLDEEGFVIGAPAEVSETGRGKRKRAPDGDNAYNPKGGHKRKSKKSSLGMDLD